MRFDLGEKLAPKMHRHGGGASAKHADHVVLEHLDDLLGKVATMVIREDKFVCHLGEFNFGLVCKRCLVVKYLVSWDNAMSSLRTGFALARAGSLVWDNFLSHIKIVANDMLLQILKERGM